VPQKRVERSWLELIANSGQAEAVAAGGGKNGRRFSKKESIYFQPLADFLLGFLTHRKKMLQRV